METKGLCRVVLLVFALSVAAGQFAARAELTSVRLGTGVDALGNVTGERSVFGPSETNIHLGGTYSNMASGTWVGRGWYPPDGSYFLEDVYSRVVTTPTNPHREVFSYTPIMPNMRSIEGVWAAVWFDNGTSASSKLFTMSYDLAAHTVAGDVVNSTPLNVRTIYSPQQQFIHAWAHFRNFALPYNNDVKFQWYGPQGFYRESVVQIANPAAGSWIPEAKVSTYIQVAGAYPATHLGDWRVDIYVKDYQGSYELKASDEFMISAIERNIRVSANALNFGTVPLGSSQNRSLTIYNDGYATLTISSLHGMTNDFSLVSPPAIPFGVGPGQSRTLTIQYAPFSRSTFPSTATLQIFSNDPDQGRVDVALTGNPLMPDIDAQTSINFGDVAVGGTGNANLIVRNVGTANLSVVGVSGLTGSAFSVVNPPAFPFTVAPGQTQTLTVRFAPATRGNAATALYVISNDPNESQFPVQLLGRGIGPDINIPEAAHDFGVIGVGTSSDWTNLTIQNTGELALSVSGLNGLPANGFSLVNPPALPFTVAPGGSQLLTVRFAPSALGAVAASLSVVSNDPDESPAAVSLQGGGAPGDIDAPTAHNFGQVHTGLSADWANLTISNTGTGVLIVTGFTGLTAGFSLVNAPAVPFTINPSASVNLTVRFAATAPGAANATLQIASSDPDENPFAVTLSGEGIEEDIDGPASYNFGSLGVGFALDWTTLTLRNSGSSDLTVTGSTGLPAGGFSLLIAPATPFTLTPGATQNLSIRFAPTAIGPANASLQIASSDPDENPFVISLTGAGTPPDIDGPAAYNFRDVSVGNTADWTTLSLRNLGPGVLAIQSLTGLDGTPFSLVNPPATPFNVAPGTSRTLTVRFAPTVVGPANATLSAASNDPDENPFTISLSGVVLANVPPTGVVDAYNVNRGGRLLLAPPGILGNDTDPNKNTLTVGGYTPPSSGWLNLAANGQTTYTLEGTLNLNDLTIASYSNQDGGTATIEDGGATVRLRGDAWKTLDLPTDVTPDTVVEFDFQCSKLGATHAIGFDNDNVHGPEFLFQLAGSDSYGIPDFRTYTGDAWKRFRIPVGKYYTGAMLYLCLVGDDGNNAECRFRNIRVYRNRAKWDAFWYEPSDGVENGNLTTVTINIKPAPFGEGVIDFSECPLSSYATQDARGQATIEESGATLRLQGNTWKKIPFTYPVTPFTVLEFDFLGTAEAELQGVGIDDDNVQDPGKFFQIWGTEQYGQQVWNDYGVSYWRHYRIYVGRYFTGPMLYLYFTSDNDAAPNMGECRFRNVYMRDLQQRVTFAEPAITPYGDQDGNGSASVHSGGTHVSLSGNTWKKFAVPYTVTPNTVVEFEFSSSKQGEVQGIGFDSDNVVDAAKVFQLYGTQTYGIQDFHNYSGSSWKSYKIPVGHFFTGDMVYLTLISDQDARGRAECWIRHVRLYESGVTLNFNDMAISGYGGQDGIGTMSIEENGATMLLVGNQWKKVAVPYVMTANTMLEFDYQSSLKPEIGAIGLDSDDGLSQGQLFELFGVQTYGLQDFNNYPGSGWVHYTIPVGSYLRGAYIYLTFANDDDAEPFTGASRFRNVRIYEP